MISLHSFGNYFVFIVLFLLVLLVILLLIIESSNQPSKRKNILRLLWTVAWTLYLGFALSEIRIVLMVLVIVFSVIILIGLTESGSKLISAIEGVLRTLGHFFTGIKLRFLYSDFLLKISIKSKYFREIFYRSQNEKNDSIMEDNLKLVLCSKRKSKTEKPLYVQRRHLMIKKFWKDWAFSIVILRNKLSITPINRKYRLKVNLSGQSYGIYNNMGKEFLRDVFIFCKHNQCEGIEGEFTSCSRSQYKKIEKKFQDWITKPDTRSKELELDLKKAPLRWASAGVLPIVKINNRYYVMLVFRTIYPIGWNLFLGASETKEEYKNLRELMLREFHEEVLIVNKEDLKSNYLNEENTEANVSYKNFEVKGCSTYLPPETLMKLQGHLENHVRLRREIDGVELYLPSTPTNTKIMLKPVDTPFEVEVTYDTPQGAQLTALVSDVIFTINPFEQGIDVVGVYEMELSPDDLPLTGELMQIGEDKYTFLREPILFLSVGKIKEMIENNELIPSDGSRVIPSLNSIDYIIEYLDAIDMRQIHVNRIINKLEQNEIIKTQKEWKEIKDLWNKYDEIIRCKSNDIPKDRDRDPTKRYKRHMEDIKKQLNSLSDLFDQIISNVSAQVDEDMIYLLNDLKLNLESAIIYFPILSKIRCHYIENREFPDLDRNNWPEVQTLLTLCPVTWKSLEILTRFGILDSFI